jgi:hypothetical protein
MPHAEGDKHHQLGMRPDSYRLAFATIQGFRARADKQ